MRLTIEDAIKKGLMHRVRVELNGKPVKDCILADEERGYIEQVVLSAFQPPMQDIPTRYRGGKVQIIVV